MVMAQSLVQELKRQDPHCVVDILAPAWSAALLERMPGVRGIVIMPVGHGRLELGTRLKLSRSLRGKYDQAIVLPNSFKSALIPFVARIPRRTGYLGEWRFGLLNNIRRLNKSILTMTVQRFVALGLSRNAVLPPDVSPPKLRVDPCDGQAALAAFGLDLDRPVLALCPGAEYGPAKRWPAGHFAEVARAMHAQGWAVWVMGSEKDQDVAVEICSLSSLAGADCVNLAGRTTLAQVVDLIALASAVVSNDSGLMHVAAALDRPLVAVYGSSDPNFTPPLSASSRIVSLGLECSPCFKRHCPLGHLDCLLRISPDVVQRALAETTAAERTETTGIS
ncbi:heptosyltransferase-2 [Desulfonatronum thiosulfatophilum]|uniref:lipopolysaccharide heptosyltransferase II n=2 Tax=Desulfonatronum thiosulfatophilum TaxID=617002 RepID=A0A1G6ATM3_9BACT|nr:heptosyltransferase-2 [Desulfonatronum thiosulfatophilum]